MPVDLPAPDRGGRLRGTTLCLVGTAAAFLLMAYEGRVAYGVLWGTLALVLAALGLLRALGLLPVLSPSAMEARSLRNTPLCALPGEPLWLAPPVSGPCAVLLAFAGTWSPGLLPAAIVAGLLCLVPAAMRRPGLLLCVIVGLLYLPALGLYGLWDPWETHYGEVAREILARDDWISLWWAQDGWFWSKPVLIFWAEALTWSAAGVDFRPDHLPLHAEWLLRLPVCMLALLAVLSVYHLVKRLFGRRAGLLCGLVLSTTPFFALLAHQAITDMYFVANMTIAVMCFLGAVTVNRDRRAVCFRVGPYALSLQHAIIVLLFLIAVPQLLYLASRNLTLAHGGFVWHTDRFLHGSAGNEGVPGNAEHFIRQPRIRGLLAQPMAQAGCFAAGLAYLLWSLRREARLRPLRMMGFYVCCALAFMGKGIPGFALPGLLALLWLMLRGGRWSWLWSGELLVARGALTLGVLGLPWFVAEFMRHGSKFTDRLLIHDHINRLTLGVHGDKGSIQYFIAQLGYGLFPWVALAPMALAVFGSALGRGPVHDRRRDSVLVLGLWFIVSFTLFSAMTTKFHHYIFPAVPPAAILSGLALERLMGRPLPGPMGPTPLREWLGRLCAVAAPLLWVVGLGGYFGDLRGIVPEGLPAALRTDWVLRQGASLWTSAALLTTGVAAIGGAHLLQRPRTTWSRRGVAAALLVGAVLVGFVGRDMAWSTGERPAGSERLIQLFIYKYERPFPSFLDYRAAFSGFACTAVILSVLAAWHRLRPVAAQAFLSLAVAFTLVLLDVYLVDLSPHWTQKHLVASYYARRSGPEEPLVAWQMNWKGENFYTGNRVAVFQDLDNKKVKKYIKDHKGVRAFFLLEHKRLVRFERMMKPRQVERLSTKRENNKFILVSAVL